MENRRSGRQLLDCVVEIVHKPMGDKGEDAFAYSFEREDIHAQAVFDGCGGSGAWQYAEYRNATGAFIAAQSMGKACLEWFDGTPSAVLKDAGKAEASFRDMAWRVLSALKSECAPMRVSGSLVRSFPCTASMAINVPDGDQVVVTALNVGDSRVYCLTPRTGLVQLTVDDTDEDPLESLRVSAPMSDMLNADHPFKVKRRQLKIPCPCAVMTATDGVFGYVRSPMDFEHIVLDAIMRSDSFARFEAMLKEEIVKRTGDDSTCILSFYGWGSFEAVRKKMGKRHEALSSIVASLDAAMKAGTLDDALNQTWKRYRKQTLYDEMQG